MPAGCSCPFLFLLGWRLVSPKLLLPLLDHVLLVYEKAASLGVPFRPIPGSSGSSKSEKPSSICWPSLSLMPALLWLLLLSVKSWDRRCAGTYAMLNNAFISELRCKHIAVRGQPLCFIWVFGLYRALQTQSSSPQKPKAMIL